jgi:hypothetical protein
MEALRDADGPLLHAAAGDVLPCPGSVTRRHCAGACAPCSATASCTSTGAAPTASWMRCTWCAAACRGTAMATVLPSPAERWRRFLPECAPDAQPFRRRHGAGRQSPVSDSRGRPEGKVVEVLERGVSRVVGRYQEESGIGVVLPDNARINQDILIPPKHERAAQARPDRKRRDHPVSRGTIAGGQGAHRRGARRTSGPGAGDRHRHPLPRIPYEWPEAVLAEAGRLREEPADGGQEAPRRPAQAALRHHRRRGCPRFRRCRVLRESDAWAAGPVGGDC